MTDTAWIDEIDELSVGGINIGPTTTKLLTTALRDSLARTEAMREALEPFAKFADNFDQPDTPDNRHIGASVTIKGMLTAGDCRRARAALETQP